MISEGTRKLIRLALDEDVGTGDLTTEATVPRSAIGEAKIIARQKLVVCGQEVAAEVFRMLDDELQYQALVPDGAEAADLEAIAEIRGRTASILTGERLALNFLQRLSGVATITRELAAIAAPVKLLDTRKTTPGMRELEKYAVKCGGAVNHRIGLYDAVLIKNNHVDHMGGDIVEAVRRCREKSPAGTKIQVEVRNQAELEAALLGGPDAVLLDNMTPEQIDQAITFVRAKAGNRIAIEVSGGISEKNLKEFARPGLDFISMGALTHSVKAADLSLRLK